MDTSKNAINIIIGTSGYSYGEWAEAGFYPAKTPSSRMLPCYAEQFSITELNYTWYQMPKAEAVERQRCMVPPHFIFAVKLTRTLTHEIDPGNWPRQAEAFREGIAPLVQSRQLSAVLIQLPPQFQRTLPNRKHLGTLLDKLAGLPLAVEFRHDSWASDAVFAELERRKVTLVTVDAPKVPHMFPCLDAVTNPELIYARFHGRNTKSWRSGNMQLQFDYDYAPEELDAWIAAPFESMAGRATKAVFFFNNHVRAQAPKNASEMALLLKKRGFSAG
jgi:uncharacterized protein YecE (DUF72 family)